MQAALRETFVQRDHELRERALRLVAPPRPPDGEKSRNSAVVESWHHGQTLGAALWRLLDRLDGAPSLEEFESLQELVDQQWRRDREIRRPRRLDQRDQLVLVGEQNRQAWQQCLDLVVPGAQHRQFHRRLMASHRCQLAQGLQPFAQALQQRDIAFVAGAEQGVTHHANGTGPLGQWPWLA